VRLALAQLNVIVGDLAGNSARIVAAIGEARAAGADLVVFPELAVTGYPPEDLLLRPGFVKAARTALDEIATATGDITALVGCPLFDRDLANACAVMSNGELLGVYRKQFLPNYGVFDEHRYFAEGRELVLLHTGDVFIGPTICEDIWQPGPPATDLALAGAQLIVNLSASPYHVGKAEEREEMLVTRARDNASYLAFCNLVGGQDELVFDGHSVVLDDEGAVIARAPGFEEALLVVDVDPTEAIGRRLRDVRRRELERTRERIPDVTIVELPAPRAQAAAAPATVAPFKPGLEQMRLALGLGVRDYVEKNGFREVVVPELEVLDFPSTEGTCEQRTVSTVAPQALTFMNGEFMNEQARALARRLTAASADDSLRIASAFRWALCRDPNDEEFKAAQEFLEHNGRQIEADLQAAPPADGSAPPKSASFEALAALCLVLLNTNDLAYVR
jgi:NAD+ synthase (glutamine-hydrolysing)